MSDYYQQLAATVCEALTLPSERAEVKLGELTLTLTAEELPQQALQLRDHPQLRFAQLIDLCGVDYDAYPQSSPLASRYAVVSHLLSPELNHRIRIRVFAGDDMPRIPSVTEIWSSGNWFEREAFDLFGILFEGHPDLRRILTDYGFIGHPFRKDFPVSGNVEMSYDAEKGRVVYRPVSVELRNQIPRVMRDDHRYTVSAVKSAE
ncbi:MAG: NADH-quinone oxidoreductase subunit C [Gammaproteobacteria bacterium]|nr:NADH-quinone oxidoreductase subunit C [Gammaproteobacteria bacterium]